MIILFQADQAKTAAAKSRVSMRDLIKWLEDSDDKFDCAKVKTICRARNLFCDDNQTVVRKVT